MSEPRQRWSLKVEDQPTSNEPGQYRAEMVSFGVRILKGAIFSVILLLILALLSQHLISGNGH